MVPTKVEKNKKEEEEVYVWEENNSVLDVLSLRSMWNIQVDMSAASMIYKAEA